MGTSPQVLLPLISLVGFTIWPPLGRVDLEKQMVSCPFVFVHIGSEISGELTYYVAMVFAMMFANKWLGVHQHDGFDT